MTHAHIVMLHFPLELSDVQWIIDKYRLLEVDESRLALGIFSAIVDSQRQLSGLAEEDGVRRVKFDE